jgi:tRNA U55 pseudouridine synthase TruB
LKELRRTRSGRFPVDGAVTVQELQNSDPVDILGRILTLPEVSRMRGA